MPLTPSAASLAPQRRWRRQALLFLTGGSVAFLIDAGGVQVLVSLLGMDPFIARAISWAFAVSFTFGFNRLITFRFAERRHLFRQWMAYVGSQSAGLLANLAVYISLVGTSPFFAAFPALAVACGAVLGATCNFLLAKRVIFRA